MERFVARDAPLKIFGLLLVDLAFVLAGLWILGAFGDVPKPGKEWAGWLSLIFFGSLAPFIVIRLLSPSDQIFIDQHGFTCRLRSDEHIGWEDVVAIAERRIQHQTMFDIHLANATRHPPTRLLGKLSKANVSLGFGDVVLSATGTNRSANELRAALLTFAPLHLFRE